MLRGCNWIILVCVLLCACGGAQEAGRVRARLDEVETWLATHPDSALAELRAIDLESLRTKKDRARAALLHSIALDKCYIDISSDSILAPALAYYRHHGSADQRLKARYYRAVLSRNALDRDTQMAWLTEAERFVPRAHDPEMAGFIYAAKRQLFLDLLDTENAYKNGLLAVDVYRNGGVESRYVNAVIALASICQMRHLYGESAVWLDTLQARWDQLTPKQRNSAYPLLLSQADTLHPEQIPDIVNAYLTDIRDSSGIHWVFLADVFQRSGQPDKAGEALHYARLFKQRTETDPDYLLAASRIEQAEGHFFAADSLYRRYNAEMTARRNRAIHSNARFEQEREQLKQRQGRLVWAACLSVGILALVSVFFVVCLRRKGERSYAQINAQQEEIDRQKAVLSQQKQQSDLIVSHLLMLFGSYADHIRSTIPDVKKNPDIQHVVDNRKQFLSDLETLYQTNIPSVEVLTKAGLTRKERGICYLFGLGLSSKEILSYLEYRNERSFYNVTAGIRRKLNLTGTKMDLQQFIRDLLPSPHK